jgi:hypothetical protein
LDVKNPLSHWFYSTTHILYNIPKQIRRGISAPDFYSFDLLTTYN